MNGQNIRTKYACWERGDKQEENISVYPVPSSGLIFVTANAESIAEIRLYDITGRLLLSIVLKTGVSFYKLDFGYITAGAYTLKVTDTNRKISSSKIILAR